MSRFGTNPEVVERDNAGPETTRNLGGDEDEDTRAVGEAALPGPIELPLDSEGEAARLVGGDVVVRAVEVA